MVKRELRDRALSQIDDDEVIRFLQEVISIPGHKDLPHHEKEVAEFFHDWFKKEGIESYLQKVEGERANVIAYIRGSEGDPKLMYNSHIDTKPPYNMSIEPFKPIIREDKVYGRGSCDAKASLTSFTFSLVALKRAGIPLAGDL
ncbi:MAG: M20/M25/M40 family metallo-hydrolase, partial [Candidatus Bathyarchaeia archaeon]